MRSIDKREVGRRFNRHAASYDRHAWVQHAMAERLVESLVASEVHPAAILELGCGTGYLTALLVERFPAARITAIDLAENMVRAAGARLAAAPRVELVVGDAEQHAWDGYAFDLIVSNATVQWFTQAEATIASLFAVLVPGGWMAHATFGPRTFEELFSVFARVESGCGASHRRHGLDLRSASQWADLLRAQGLTSVQATSQLVRGAYASCRACLAEIRGTGASHSPGTPHDLSVLTEVMRRYDEEHRAGAGVYATYEVLALSARKLC